jgi:hypothetical protein
VRSAATAELCLLAAAATAATAPATATAAGSARSAQYCCGTVISHKRCTETSANTVTVTAVQLLNTTASFGIAASGDANANTDMLTADGRCSRIDVAVTSTTM